MPLPAPAVGKNLRVFAAENRAALLTANQRLQADADFYGAVHKEFGQ